MDCFVEKRALTVGRKKKASRLMTAHECLLVDQRECDAVMEEAQRSHERPPVILKLRAPDPLAKVRAANAARRKARASKLSAADEAFIDRVFAADRVDGWKQIARVLGRDEKTVRTDAFVRRWVYKTGGRYWADPMELWANLGPYFDDRRAKARQATALRQSRAPGPKRGVSSTFAKRRGNPS